MSKSTADDSRRTETVVISGDFRSFFAIFAVTPLGDQKIVRSPKTHIGVKCPFRALALPCIVSVGDLCVTTFSFLHNLGMQRL